MSAATAHEGGIAWCRAVSLPISRLLRGQSEIGRRRCCFSSERARLVRRRRSRLARLGRVARLGFASANAPRSRASIRPSASATLRPWCRVSSQSTRSRLVLSGVLVLWPGALLGALCVARLHKYRLAPGELAQTGVR